MKKTLYIILNISLLLGLILAAIMANPPFNIVAISILILILTIFILGVVIYNILGKVGVNNHIKSVVDDRLWDIPIGLQCQICGSKQNIDFSLDTSEFTCGLCGNRNRIYLQFLVTPIDKNNPDIE